MITATFGRGGRRWARGQQLRVHALNPERGTGSTTHARLDLLRRAIDRGGQAGRTVYLTSAGFFGCTVDSGNSSSGVWWHGISPAEEQRIQADLSVLASHLGSDVWLCVGFDRDEGYQNQELWWFRGGDGERLTPIVRNRTPIAERVVAIGSFKVLGFVCGGIFGNNGIPCDVETDTDGIDVVIDAAHASMDRQWDRELPAAAIQQRRAFHRTIREIGSRCGGVFAQARGADESYVRNCDNWIVYRDKHPFPDPRTGTPLQ